MPTQVDARAVQAVLYGIYKALHGVAGASSAAIMRKAAPDILDALTTFGVELPAVNSIEKLQEVLSQTMVAAGCCEGMKFTQDGNKLTASISQCSFFDLTQELGKKDIPPFGCPFAALTLAVADRSLNKRGRIVHLAPTEDGKPGDTTLVVELHDKI
jgi:hypothetical protein